MKKTIGKSIFAAIAIGLLSTSYVLADTVERDVDNQKTIDDNKKLVDRYRWYDQLDNGDIVHHNVDASTNDFDYDLQIPSYLPKDYAVRDVKAKNHDVLETVYWKQGKEYQERSGRWVNHTMVFRMSYSMDTVWPEEYIPREYHDVQWTDSTPTGDVHYTGDVDKGLVRSVTWYKDNMAYFLFFQVPVKASEADFYRNHVVPLKDIDPSRTDLIGVKTIR